jgi:hypothetical protein
MRDKNTRSVYEIVVSKSHWKRELYTEGKIKT